MPIGVLSARYCIEFPRAGLSSFDSFCTGPSAEFPRARSCDENSTGVRAELELEASSAGIFSAILNMVSGKFTLDLLLPVPSVDGVTGRQRRRLLRDVNSACDALNLMHGEGHRPMTPRLLLWPARTRFNVFARTCSKASSRQPCFAVTCTSCATDD